MAAVALTWLVVAAVVFLAIRWARREPAQERSPHVTPSLVVAVDERFEGGVVDQEHAGIVAPADVADNGPKETRP